MGFFDWAKQAVSDAGRWVKDKVISPVSSGISWVNENVVQPVARTLAPIPGIGQIAGTVAAGANAADAVGKMVSGREQFDLGRAKEEAQKVRGAYQSVRKNLPAVAGGIVPQNLKRQRIML